MRRSDARNDAPGKPVGGRKPRPRAKPNDVPTSPGKARRPPPAVRQPAAAGPAVRFVGQPAEGHAMVARSARARLAVGPDRLRRHLDPATLPFATTAEIPPLEGTIGQPRAIDALAFGLEVRARGFNVFASGQEGSGREGTVLAEVARFARNLPTPPDLVYVHDFAAPDRPRAITLPAGRGTELARDMDEFAEACARDIPHAFDSDEYDRRRREALAEIQPERERLIDELRAFARQHQFAVEITDTGLVTIPLVNDQPLSEDAYQQFDVGTRRELEQRNDIVHERAETTLRQLRQLDKQAGERVRQLDAEVARFAIGPLLEELRQKYTDLSVVRTWLGQIEADVVKRLPFLRGSTVDDEGNGADEEEDAIKLLADHIIGSQQPMLERYRINVVVDHRETQGAPIVVERQPTQAHLLGRVEYRQHQGAMITDFRQIRAGALHRSNGGFLVLRVLDVLRRPHGWEALKHALATNEIAMEAPTDEPDGPPTTTLLPEPIALDVKVVLIGPVEVWQMLYHTDDQFRELFRVKADFAPDMPWREDTILAYAAFLSRCARERNLLPFDRGAVARIVEHGARLREHQERLTSQLRAVADLATEAAFWAARAGHDAVQAQDVDEAVHKQRYRSNLVEEELQSLITEGTLRIETAGGKAGVVNGIAVLDLGDHAFGRPARITATVAAGRGSVRSIERESKLSGRIHSKGFLALLGYLAEHYAQRVPLMVSATLTFEQSYDEIEGDSASLAELCALLSALSGLPVAQGIAVTGAVDQRGEVMAVGGIAEKIEGFFAVCRARGLDGQQGVVIPATNLPHLMLDPEVVAAVAAGRFRVWAVATVDEAIEVLTGRPAGAQDGAGRYPAGSVHRLAQARLHGFAQAVATLRGPGVVANEPEPLVAGEPEARIEVPGPGLDNPATTKGKRRTKR